MKYIVGAFAVLLVVASIIALILGLIGRGDRPATIDDERSTLTEHMDSSSEVTFTTYGRIIADEEFRAIRIRVSDRERSVEVLRGYNLAVEERQRFSNNTNSYGAFMYSLENAGFLEMRTGQADREDGKCPTSQRYVYELDIDNEQVHRSWASTCRGEQGTFGGNRSIVDRLFQAQIPDYRDLSRSVNL